MIDISVIIVSYNTSHVTCDAIASVYATTKRNFEIIVVDNASSDDSVKQIKKKFPKVILIHEKENHGFAKGNNIGAKKASGKYLVFLNSDTILQEHALDTLFEAMEKDEHIGVCSGMLLNIDRTVQPQGGGLPSLLRIAAWMWFVDDIPFISSLFLSYQQRNNSFFLKKQSTGWVGGTALCIRKDFFNEIGGWDENIFMYAEDVELCMRVEKHGKSVMLIPEAKIIHLQNVSTGGSSASLIGEITGLLYIYKKHFSGIEHFVLTCILITGVWLRIFIFGILLHDEKRKQAYVESTKYLSFYR